MAVKVTYLRVLWWKLKCLGLFRFPPAFWFGFWFSLGVMIAFGTGLWVWGIGRQIASLLAY